MELDENESELGHPGGWRQEWNVVVNLLGEVGSRQAEVSIRDCALAEVNCCRFGCGEVCWLEALWSV